MILTRGCISPEIQGYYGNFKSIFRSYIDDKTQSKSRSFKIIYIVSLQNKLQKSYWKHDATIFFNTCAHAVQACANSHASTHTTHAVIGQRLHSSSPPNSSLVYNANAHGNNSSVTNVIYIYNLISVNELLASHTQPSSHI